MKIAIYGSGGFGREVAWLASDCTTDVEAIEVIAFIEDNPQLLDKAVNGITVTSLDSLVKSDSDAHVVIAVGSPKHRQKLSAKVSAVGLPFTTLIHPRSDRSKFIVFGQGTLVCAGCILTTNITIGNHVHINLDCTIGHDAILKDYTTLAPGVHVSGWVHFEERVYVGTGAVIINGTADNPLIIGSDAVIGAGACVTKSVASGTTVVGVPARPLHK